jgi:hypothetical protein
MSGRLRFTAVLVVLLVIGLAGMASGNDGDPIIVGQTVTTDGTQTKLLYDSEDTPIGASLFEVQTRGTDVAIQGESVYGYGVLGESRGFGVRGFGQDGGGVYGQGGTEVGGLVGSVGVRAEGAVDDFGNYDVGLQSIGQVQFSKASATAKVASGQNSVTVHVKFDLRTGSMVLATSQSSGGSVKYVQKNPTNDTFTIVLRKAATKDTLVAWFVISPYPLP